MSRNLNNMTHVEINAIVFEGARADETRGLRDALTDDEILALPEHPAYDEWPTGFTDWVWSAIDNIMNDQAWADGPYGRIS